MNDKSREMICDLGLKIYWLVHFSINDKATKFISTIVTKSATNEKEGLDCNISKKFAMILLTIGSPEWKKGPSLSQAGYQNRQVGG